MKESISTRHPAASPRPRWRWAGLLALLLALLAVSPAAWAAEPAYTYTVRNVGTGYSAANDDGSFSSSGTLSEVAGDIDAHRSQGGSPVPCLLYLGDDSPLDVGTSGLILQNGEYELRGSVTGAVTYYLNGCVTVQGTAVITSSADIVNTSTGSALVLDNALPQTITGGHIRLNAASGSAAGRAALRNNDNTCAVSISGGLIESLDSSAPAIYNYGAGSILISGGHIRVSAIGQGNTIQNHNGTLEISGGLLENNGSGCVIAVTNIFSKISISGQPVLYAYNNYVIDNFSGSLSLSGSPTLCGRPSSEPGTKQGAAISLTGSATLRDAGYQGSHLALYLDGTLTAGNVLVRGGGAHGDRWSLATDAEHFTLTPGGTDNADLLIAARPAIAAANQYTLYQLSSGSIRVSNSNGTLGSVADLTAAMTLLENNRQGAPCSIDLRGETFDIISTSGQTLALTSGSYFLTGVLQAQNSDGVRISGGAEVVSTATVTVVADTVSSAALRVEEGSLEALGGSINVFDDNSTAVPCQAVQVENGSFLLNGSSIAVYYSQGIGVLTQGENASFTLAVGTISSMRGLALANQGGQMDILGGWLDATVSGRLLESSGGTVTTAGGVFWLADTSANRGFLLSGGSGLFGGGIWKDQGGNNEPLLTLSDATAEISGGDWQSSNEYYMLSLKRDCELTVSGGSLDNSYGSVILASGSANLILAGGRLTSGYTTVEAECQPLAVTLRNAPYLSSASGTEISLANALVDEGYGGGPLRIFYSGDQGAIPLEEAGPQLVWLALENSRADNWSLTNEDFYLREETGGLHICQDHRPYTYTLTNSDSGYAVRNGLGQTIGSDGQSLYQACMAMASDGATGGSQNHIWLYLGAAETPLNTGIAGLTLNGDLFWHLRGVAQADSTNAAAMVTCIGSSTVEVKASLSHSGSGSALSLPAATTTVTIVEGATLSGASGSDATLRQSGSGSLTISGGSIAATGSSSALAISGGSAAVISGGTFTGKTRAVLAYSGSGSLRVDGGSFTSTSGPALQYSGSGPLAVNQGDFYSGSAYQATLLHSGGGLATLNGGSFNAQAGPALEVSGSGSISCGQVSFTSLSGPALLCSSANGLSVGGGSFASTSGPALENDGGGLVAVTGGSFTSASGPAAQNSAGSRLELGGGSFSSEQAYAVVQLDPTAAALSLSGNTLELSGGTGQISTASAIDCREYTAAAPLTLLYSGLLTDTPTLLVQGRSDVNSLRLQNIGAVVSGDQAANTLAATDPNYTSTYMLTNYGSGYAVSYLGSPLGTAGQNLTSAIGVINNHRGGSPASVNLGGNGLLRVGTGYLYLSSSSNGLTLLGRVEGTGSDGCGLIDSAATDLVVNANITCLSSNYALRLISGSAQLRGGTLSSGGTAVRCENISRLTISGAKLLSTSNAALTINSGGAVTISDGVLATGANGTAAQNAVIYVGSGNAAASLTISGGSFTSTNGSAVLMAWRQPQLYLSGAPVFDCGGPELVLQSALHDQGYNGQTLTISAGEGLSGVTSMTDPLLAPVVVAGGGGNLSRYQLSTRPFGHSQLPNHVLQAQDDDLVGLVNPALDMNEYLVTFLPANNVYGLSGGYSVIDACGQRLAYGNDYSSYSRVIAALDSGRLESDGSWRPIGLYFANTIDPSQPLSTSQTVELPSGDYTVYGRLTAAAMVLNVTSDGAVTISAELENTYGSASESPCVSYSGSGSLTIDGGSLTCTETGSAALLLPVACQGRVTVNSGLLAVTDKSAIPLLNLSASAQVAIGSTPPLAGQATVGQWPLFVSPRGVAVYTLSPLADAGYNGPPLSFYYEGLTDGQLAVANGGDKTNWQLANVRLALTTVGNDLQAQADASAPGRFTYTVQDDGQGGYNVYRGATMVAGGTTLANTVNDYNYTNGGVMYYINQDRIHYGQAYADAQIRLTNATDNGPLRTGSDCLALTNGRLWVSGGLSGTPTASYGDTKGILMVSSSTQAILDVDLTSASPHAPLLVEGSATLTGGTLVNTDTYGQVIYVGTNGVLRIDGAEVLIEAKGAIDQGDLYAAIYSKGANAIIDMQAGTVRMNGYAPAIYSTGANGQVRLSGGLVENIWPYQSAGSQAVLGSNGSLTVDGATLRCTAANSAVEWSCVGDKQVTIAQSDPTRPTLIHSPGPALTIRGGTADTTALAISGGRVESTAAGKTTLAFGSFAGVVRISGGSLSSAATVLDSQGWLSGAALRISGGSFSSTDGSLLRLAHPGLTEISNGTLTSAANAPVILLPGQGNTAASSLLISGGTIANSSSDFDGGAILNQGLAAVTISGGRITADAGNAVELTGAGQLTVSGDAIVAGGDGKAIANQAGGSVLINGGTVQGQSNDTIWNQAAGSVTVSSGTVATSGSGNALWNQGAGEIIVSGGSVECSGSGDGIYNNAQGSVTVSSGSVTVAASGSGYALTNSGSGSLTVSGGRVRNQGSQAAIFTSGSGQVSITQTASVEAANGPALLYGGSGSVTVSGGQLSGTAAVETRIASGRLHISGGSLSGDYALRVLNPNAGTVCLFTVSGDCELSGSIADILTDRAVTDGGYNGSAPLTITWPTPPADGSLIVSDGAANREKWQYAGYALQPGGSGDAHLLAYLAYNFQLDFRNSDDGRWTEVAAVTLTAPGQADQTLTGGSGQFSGQAQPGTWQALFYDSDSVLLGQAVLTLNAPGQTITLRQVTVGQVALPLDVSALEAEETYRFVLAFYDENGRFLSAQLYDGPLSGIDTAFQAQASAYSYQLLSLDIATLIPLNQAAGN